MDSKICMGLGHRCDVTKEGFHFRLPKLCHPLEPRDSPMWLSVRFQENLGRVSFVFSRCETKFNTYHLSYFSYNQQQQNINIIKRPSAIHESSKLLQRCSNTNPT